MADSKLRLQIVTALDNAGIKATKDQIESLNSTLSKTGDGNKLGEIERTIGKMEGPLGKLQELFENCNGTIAKFGVKSLAVLAAFKAGWDIGEWINEKIINQNTPEQSINKLLSIIGQKSNANKVYLYRFLDKNQ